jgi:hypothetical protein
LGLSFFIWHGGASASQVAVLGYEVWHRLFGAASDVIGKDMRIEGRPFTIVGITRKWFTGMTTGEPPEVTLQLSQRPLACEPTSHLKLTHKLAAHEKEMIEAALRKSEGRVSGPSGALQSWGLVDRH